eukprot:gnl/MRDRNA2_/MRDRNA2_88615_c0_seq1.p1 gnl/MRDRNA2_/MRDRNA2_88615_c0~~gnl/MRDRNA2_/MRDRNA2_88615_c0_seq1.p1  ORF type:complete len:781 (+),score=214.70 gnl/MRDRNA2_/MRDRNA2_88615_c0_seq1:81-2423(+)
MSELNHNRLLVKAIQVLESYDPRKATVDAHFDECPVAQDKNLDHVDQKFLHQVFYGCIRYQKFLKLFVTSFLYKNTSCVQRSDQSLYMVLGYLVFFRLQDLGVEEFRQFIFCGLGTPPAMHAFLQYCFSEEDLNTWVKMEWCKVYDIKYIEDEVIGKMQTLKQDPDMIRMFNDMELKATGVLQSSDDTASSEGLAVKVKKPTKCEPFNLTKPKPRLIPLPQEISTQIKALPVPNMINSTNLISIAEERKASLEQEREHVSSKYSKDLEFNLETAKRTGPDEREEIRREVEEIRFQECTFKPAVSKPYHPVQQIAEVRQNQAAVLREDALVNKKQAKEYKILKNYEEELRDASEFHEWQNGMRYKDHCEEEMRIHKRKVMCQMQKEMAMEAHDAYLRFNHLKATQHKSEMKLALAAQETEQHEKLQENKQLVHDVIGDRHRPRDAEQAVLEDNKKRAEDVRKVKEKELEIKKREDEKEMERRKDIIRQIRALERVNATKVKTFDAAEDPRGGYMEEMSLSELRERLQLLKSQHEKEVETRREANLEKKERKQQEFAEKANNLARTRSQAKIQAQERHERLRAKQLEEEKAKAKFHEECILEVAELRAQKKRQKRMEERRLMKELKEISVQQQFLAGNADMVEAKGHFEQQKGLQREARVRQDESLLKQVRANEVKAQEYKEKVKQKALEREEMRVMCSHVDKRLAKAKVDDAALKEDIRNACSTAKMLQRIEETKLDTTIGHSSNKYSSHKRIILPSSDEGLRRSLSLSEEVLRRSFAAKV